MYQRTKLFNFDFFCHSQTFIGLLVGAENISRTGPLVEAFSSARGSAESIFNVIDRKSKIDAMSNEGKLIESVQGRILFKNVFFSYPSRPDVPVKKKKPNLLH